MAHGNRLASDRFEFPYCAAVRFQSARAGERDTVGPTREIDMPAPDLIPSHPKHLWLDRFGARLKQLKPSMNFPTAAKHALVTWPGGADREPEAAAEIYAAEELRNLPATDAGFASGAPSAWPRNT